MDQTRLVYNCNMHLVSIVLECARSRRRSRCLLESDLGLCGTPTCTGCGGAPGNPYGERQIRALELMQVSDDMYFVLKHSLGTQYSFSPNMGGRKGAWYYRASSKSSGAHQLYTFLMRTNSAR